MRKKTRFNRDCLTAEQKDLRSWATVNTELLEEAEKELVGHLEASIRAIMAGASAKETCGAHGIVKQELYRYLERCLMPHDDGRIYGWRGLLPYVRQKEYTRRVPVPVQSSTTRGGASGALGQLFDRYEDLKQALEDVYFKETKNQPPEEVPPAEPRIPLTPILIWFHGVLRKKGLTAKDWPFSTKNLGRMAVWRYLRKLGEREPERLAKARFGIEVARRVKASGNGTAADTILRPLQRVQFDGHRFDAFCALLMEHPYGGYIRQLLHRLWLLLIIDVASRAILGYHISLNREYNAQDVLRCVKNAITPWKPRELTISGLEYPPSGGLPSGVFEGLQWGLWDELSLDNAKANLADQVLRKITSVVGCAINPGPVATPERRGIVERVFETLEENGYHRLPSTTGSGPNDPRRNNPEEAALEWEIWEHDLHELTDVLCAHYNATPQAGIGYRSPLEVLDFYLQQPDSFIRQVPEDQRAKLGLLDLEDTRVVRGSVAQVKRPYIQYANVRYQSDLLARSPYLVGKKLHLLIDPDDPRTIRSYLPNGAEFGVLTAHGLWGRRPHSLEMRNAVFGLKHKRLIYFSQNQDPIPVYMKYRADQKTKAGGAALAKARPYVIPSNAKPEISGDSTHSTGKQSDARQTHVDTESVAVEANTSTPLRRTFTF